MERVRWVFLVYRLPREPSTPRIAVWRKLRRLGALHMVDGLVALPSDARTDEHLGWIADEVIEAGGEASIWFAEAASRRQEREYAARLAAGVAEEYESVIRAAEAAVGEPAGQRLRTLRRLRRELRRIRDRDFFPPPAADKARSAVEMLARRVEEARL